MILITDFFFAFAIKIVFCTNQTICVKQNHNIIFCSNQFIIFNFDFENVENNSKFLKFFEIVFLTKRTKKDCIILKLKNIKKSAFEIERSKRIIRYFSTIFVLNLFDILKIFEKTKNAFLLFFLSDFKTFSDGI